MANAIPETVIDPDTERLIEQINDLTLPLMWSMRQQAARLCEPLGISPNRAHLLELIGRGIAYPKDLSELLDTVPPAISVMLAELEARGLINRQPDPEDRRRIRLDLTGKGQALSKMLKTHWQQASRQRFARIAPEDLRTLLRVFRTLLDSAPPDSEVPWDG